MSKESVVVEGSVPRWSRLMRRVVNRPAELPSSQALMRGVAWLIIGAILGWYFDLVPASMLSYTWGSTSLLWHTALGLVMWVSSTVVVFAFAAIINRHTAITDLFGRMLFAHWPVTLMMLPAVVGDRVLYVTFMNNPISAFNGSVGYALAMAVFMLIVAVWYLFWGYCAFARATERRGVWCVVAYVVAMLLSLFLSHYTLVEVYGGIGR